MAKKKRKKPDKYEKLVSLLIENFVNIQKIFTKTSEKFEELSEQISKLLQLFEISAKSFSEKLNEKIEEVERDKEFVDKLDKLLEQNKLIAKGLTLLEERMRERVTRTTHPRLPPQPRQIQHSQTAVSEIRPSLSSQMQQSTHQSIRPQQEKENL